MKIEIDSFGDTYIIEDKDTSEKLAFFYSSSISDLEKFLTPNQYKKFIGDKSISFTLSQKRYDILVETFKSFCDGFRVKESEIMQRLGERRYNEIFGEDE